MGWAVEAYNICNISIDGDNDIKEFLNVTGKELLNYKESDFYNLLNSINGYVLYQCFTDYVERRRKKSYGFSENTLLQDSYPNLPPKKNSRFRNIETFENEDSNDTIKSGKNVIISCYYVWFLRYR